MTGRRVLVVDDDASIRILVTRLLSQHGFLVDSVRDGAEAIERILERDYSLVILDLMMPRVDGFAVIRYLRDHRPELLSSLIVMTAFGSQSREEVCPPVGCFIEKPFDVERLLEEAERHAIPLERPGMSSD